MRCLMGEAHRRAILDRCFEGARVLEWGMGGSTVWLAEHLPRGARLVSVEHDPRWHDEVSRAVGERGHCELLLREQEGPARRNATPEEEDPAGLERYIGAVDGRTFDVIVVDGVARRACLERARGLLAPGGIVFLHDAQRPWYDGAKRLLIEREVIGTCPDYPPPWLWSGVSDVADIDPPGRFQGLVVSFYTKGTAYEEEARSLRDDCQRLALEAVIEGVEPAGSWERNTSLKADFCRTLWHDLERPIVWIDADARVRRQPGNPFAGGGDLAVHRWHGWEFTTGTLFLNQTEGARRFLDAWKARCDEMQNRPDQLSADLAWEDVSVEYPLRTIRLPRSYCQIFDREQTQGEPVIEHFQASRRLKAGVSGGVARPFPEAASALVQARAASRPRRWRLTAIDSALPVEERVAEVEEELAVAGSRAVADCTWMESVAEAVETHDQRAWEAVVGDRAAALADRLAARGAGRFVVYGAGEVGRAVVSACRRRGLAPVAFVESVARRQAVDGLPIWSPARASDAGIEVFVLGTFGSVAGMLGNLERECAGRGARYHAEVLAGPAPVRVSPAQQQLRAALSVVGRGRTLSDYLWVREDACNRLDAGVALVEGALRLSWLDCYRFASKFAGGARVLDCPSGTGFGSYWLRAHGYASLVVGIEPDEGAAGYAGRVYGRPDVRFLAGSAADAETPGAPFDLVVSFDRAQRVGDLQERVRRVGSALASGGRFIVSLPWGAPAEPGTAAACEALAMLRDWFDEIEVHGQWTANETRPTRFEVLEWPTVARGDEPTRLVATCRGCRG